MQPNEVFPTWQRAQLEQRDQRGREPRVDALRALRRRVTRDVDLERPVDGVLG